MDEKYFVNDDNGDSTVSLYDVSIPYDAPARLAFSQLTLPETEYPKFRTMYEKQQVAEATLKKKQRDLMAAKNKAEQTLLKTRNIVRVNDNKASVNDGVTMFPSTDGKRSSIVPTSSARKTDVILYSDQEQKSQRSKTVAQDVVVVVVPPKQKSDSNKNLAESIRNGMQKVDKKANVSLQLKKKPAESKTVVEKTRVTDPAIIAAAKSVNSVPAKKRNDKQKEERKTNNAASAVYNKKNGVVKVYSDQEWRVKQVEHRRKVVERVAPVQPRSNTASRLVNSTHRVQPTRNGQQQERMVKQVESKSVVEKIAVVEPKTKVSPKTVKNGKTVAGKNVNGKELENVKAKTNGALELDKKEKNGVAPTVSKQEEKKNGAENPKETVMLQADQNQFPAKVNEGEMVYKPVRRRPAKTVTLLPQDVMGSRKRADNIALFVNR